MQCEGVMGGLERVRLRGKWLQHEFADVAVMDLVGFPFDGQSEDGQTGLGQHRLHLELSLPATV